MTHSTSTAKRPPGVNGTALCLNCGDLLSTAEWLFEPCPFSGSGEHRAPPERMTPDELAELMRKLDLGDVRLGSDGYPRGTLPDGRRIIVRPRDGSGGRCPHDQPMPRWLRLVIDDTGTPGLT